MRNVTDMRELQLIQSNVLYDLTEFCEKHQIIFYLLGGTLIGAVRHGGYIPWDDDMDIAMSRTEYDKLLAIGKNGISDRCSILAPETNGEYKGYIPQIIYNDSKLVSGQYRTKEDLNIGISVFVYDGIPDNKLVRKCFYYEMYFLRALHALCRANFKNTASKNSRIIGPVLSLFVKEKNVYKYRDQILSCQRKYLYEQSAKVSPNADTRSYLEDVEKRKFESEIKKEFEGITCSVFSHYEEHLTTYYGNYMQLPPVEQQTAKHSFDAWIEDGFENKLKRISGE